MRKLIASNLLLIMFLVGAASGFLVSSIGWLGLHQGGLDLEQLHKSGSEVYKQISDVEKVLLRCQAVLIDAIKKQRLTASDRESIRQVDAELEGMLHQQQRDPKSSEQWNHILHLHTRLAASRQHVLTLNTSDPGSAYQFYVTNTLPLHNQIIASLHQFIPSAAQSSEAAYEKAVKDNRLARDTLLGMSLLATVFFCMIAWLTYRESMDRRRKTAALDQEHTLFRTLFESGNDGVILLNGEHITDINLAALHLFAVPAGHDLGQIDLNKLQPDEQPDGTPSASALHAHIATARQNGSQRFEWLFRTTQGKEFPAELAIDVAHLASGSTIQLTVRDISDRKIAENSMRLANQAFENSLEGIAITDADSNILTVNSAFTTITGYPREEVIGRNPRLLSSGRQSREFYDEMWRSIDTLGKWQGEIWNIRKNGDIYPQWLNISRVTDDHGKVINYVGVFSDISERKSAEERILHQVYYDQLTDLPNRVLFTDRLNQVMGLAKRHENHHFAVMFLDLDRFKLINDSMGHDAGDQLLQQTALRLRGSMRESDTVARMGGDEFTIVLTEIRTSKDAAAVAQKILDAFHPPFYLNGEEVFVSISIGISVYPEDGSNVEILLKNADMAMYRAKGAGGSWFELYDEGLSTLSSQRLSMETALHKALEREEMQLHYQPQFDCESGKLIGFEALLRWQHPERGLLAPEAFLGIAEETGLIVPIGEWVLHTACVQAQTWRRDFPGHRLMAVNLSARQFQSADLTSHVSTALQKSGLPHFCLELEITETVVMQNLETSISIMHQLAELGVQFSIDDFGTGHSSLAYLKKLPIHALKIDRSFIRDVTTDVDDAAICSAIVAMANKLGLRVVAEGIEDKKQLALLKQYKAIAGQGYLLGRPVPVEAATKMIAEGKSKAVLA